MVNGNAKYAFYASYFGNDHYTNMIPMLCSSVTPVTVNFSYVTDPELVAQNHAFQFKNDESS